MDLEFYNNLWDFMALEKPFIFGASTVILAIFVVILDFGTYYLLDRKSFLNITYNIEDLSPNKIRFYYFIFFYVICAGIVGFLGVIINMLNYNIQAALLTCLGWPNVLSRIINQTDQQTEEQPDDDENNNEEEE